MTASDGEERGSVTGGGADRPSGGSPYDQRGYRSRFDWGRAGAAAIGGGTGAPLAVVVDVLSFTTTLSVAADRGVEVHPYRWKDAHDGTGGAAAYAAAHDAVLAVGRTVGRTVGRAVGRTAAAPGQVSLDPRTVRRAAALSRLVLPSPNGATLACDLAAGGGRVFGACLRNAGAVGDHLAALLAADADAWVAVVAAGELGADGSLRVAVEDLWGAGAVLARLEDAGFPGSPEAGAAAAAYRHLVRGDVTAALRASGSGRELTAAGHGDELPVAAELDASRAVPELRDGRFVPATR